MEPQAADPGSGAPRDKRRVPMMPFHKRVMRCCEAPPSPGDTQLESHGSALSGLEVWCAEVTEVTAVEGGPLQLSPFECERTLLLYFNDDDLAIRSVWQVHQPLAAALWLQSAAENEVMQTLPCGDPSRAALQRLRATIAHPITPAQHVVGVWVPTYWSQVWGVLLHGFPSQPLMVYTTPEDALRASTVPSGTCGGYARSLLFCWAVLNRTALAASEEGLRHASAPPSRGRNWLSRSGTAISMGCPRRDLLAQYVLWVGEPNIDDASDSDLDVAESAMRDARKWAMASQWIMTSEAESATLQEPVDPLAALGAAEQDFRAVLWNTEVACLLGEAQPLLLERAALAEEGARHRLHDAEEDCFHELLVLESLFYACAGAGSRLCEDEEDEFVLLATVWNAVVGTAAGASEAVLSGPMPSLLKAALQRGDADRTRILVAGVSRMLAVFPEGDSLSAASATALSSLLVAAVQRFGSDLTMLVDAMVAFELVVPPPAEPLGSAPLTRSRRLERTALYYTVFTQVLAETCRHPQGAVAESAASTPEAFPTVTDTWGVSSLGPTLEQVACHALRALSAVGEPLSAAPSLARHAIAAMHTFGDCVAVLDEGFRLLVELLPVQPALLGGGAGVLEVACSTAKRLVRDGDRAAQLRHLHESLLQCFAVLATAPAVVKERMCLEGVPHFLELALRNYADCPAVCNQALCVLDCLSQSLSARAALVSPGMEEVLRYLESAACPRIARKAACVRCCIDKVKMPSVSRSSGAAAQQCY